MSDLNDGKTPDSKAKVVDATVVKGKASYEKTPIDKTVIRPKSKPGLDGSAVQAPELIDSTVYKPPSSHLANSSPSDASSSEAVDTAVRVSLDDVTQVRDQSGSSVKTEATDDATKISALAQLSPSTEGMITVGSLNYPEDHEEALTRIREVIIGQDNSQGFSKARRAADKALSNNEIILNRRFVLEAILGAGGMGTVYRARDLRKVEANDLDPYVAVKVLNEDFKHHPDAFVSLQREASRSHQLAHPNIVTVHDFDRDGDVIYMTMELLKGEGLDILMREYKDKGLALEKALPIISGFCKALIYAHKQHIIHSDLKPGNIFIDKTGAKVLDYGTARIASQAQVKGDFDAGQLGALTPAYASLEMLRDDLDDETHSSDDVFAVGIIVYELLTGKHPYNRKPADKALIENLKPKRIASLSKRRWRTLESALKLHRADRLQSINEFYDGFFQKKKFPIFKVASVLLLGVIGWFGYQRYVVPDELTVTINTTFDKAQSCFDSNNYACAIDGAKAVIQMSPKHTEAKALLGTAQTQLFDEKVAGLVKSAQECLQNQDLECAKNHYSLLENLSPDSVETESVGEKIIETKQSMKFVDALAVSEKCLSDKNYACAINAAKTALSVKPESQQAKQQLEESEKYLASVKNLYQKHMAEAKKCFAKRNYKCTIESAKAALKYSKTTEAQSIKQKAEYATVERQKKIASARKMLAEGKACFNAKRYTCAILKSESALEFLPGYRPAISLRQSARSAIEKLKKSITIQ